MAMNLLPFNPQSPTAALTVIATSASVKVPTTNSSPNLVSLRIVNDGTNFVYVNFGASGVTAAIPASGATTTGLMLLPNSVTYVMVQSGYSEDNPDNTSAVYVAAIAGATGNTIYITVGESGMGG